MLICNINALQTVYSLYFLEKVILYGPDSLDFEKIVGIDGTLGEIVTGFDDLSLFNLKA